MHPIPHGPGAHRRIPDCSGLASGSRAIGEPAGTRTRPGALNASHSADAPPLASAAGNPLANPVSGCEANDQRDYTRGHCNAPPLPSRLASRACIRRTFSGRTRSKLQRSQQRPSLTGCALLPKPTIAPPQIEHACTGFIVRAPWCAHGQAQQRSGRPGLSNMRPAPRSCADIRQPNVGARYQQRH